LLLVFYLLVVIFEWQICQAVDCQALNCRCVTTPKGHCHAYSLGVDVSVSRHTFETSWSCLRLGY